MHAVVRVNAWDPAKRESAAGEIAEFDRLHAEQPGFIGSLVVDIGEGRHAIVNLWRSQDDAAAAQPVMGPAAGRLLGPLMAQPPRLIGVGEVIGGTELVTERA